MKRKQANACPWCGRAASTCWIMPCLDLETALARADDRRMARWAKAAGIKLQNAQTGKVVG